MYLYLNFLIKISHESSVSLIFNRIASIFSLWRVFSIFPLVRDEVVLIFSLSEIYRINHLRISSVKNKMTLCAVWNRVISNCLCQGQSHLKFPLLYQGWSRFETDRVVFSYLCQGRIVYNIYSILNKAPRDIFTFSRNWYVFSYS